MARTEIKIIDCLESLPSTCHANPRWLVTFTDGEQAYTQSDAACAYGLADRQYRGVPVVFTFSRAGRITHATPAG